LSGKFKGFGKFVYELRFTSYFDCLFSGLPATFLMYVYGVSDPLKPCWGSDPMTVLQPLRCVDCVIHHERDVREE